MYKCERRGGHTGVNSKERVFHKEHHPNAHRSRPPAERVLLMLGVWHTLVVLLMLVVSLMLILGMSLTLVSIRSPSPPPKLTCVNFLRSKFNLSGFPSLATRLR